MSSWVYQCPRRFEILFLSKFCTTLNGMLYTVIKVYPPKNQDEAFAPVYRFIVQRVTMANENVYLLLAL